MKKSSHVGPVQPNPSRPAFPTGLVALASWKARSLAASLHPWSIALLAALGTLAVPASAKNGPPGHYQQTNLVADVAGQAAATDPHLVNPWGLSASTAGPWWVANNGTGTSTLYNGAGAIQSLVVTLPNVPGETAPPAITGIVFNRIAADFLVEPGKPARFLFASEEGAITGWNSGPTGVLLVNNGGRAVYKGLAVATRNGVQHLYAPNFQTGRVDVFDRAFQPVDLGPSAFRDRVLPASFVPFNVQTVGGSLYVTFAQKEGDSIEEVHGPGRGFVDVFSPDGVLQKRLRWGPWFNAPWGVALAPADFGAFSNLILVGQFGSGKIAAFDPNSGDFRGLMRGEHGRTLRIDGLWALAFGNSANAGAANTLYFTAGTDDEAHGLFGTLTPLAATRGDREADEPDDDEGRDD